MLLRVVVCVLKVCLNNDTNIICGCSQNKCQFPDYIFDYTNNYHYYRVQWCIGYGAALPAQWQHCRIQLKEVDMVVFEHVCYEVNYNVL